MNPYRTLPWLSLVAVCATGCGGGSLPPEADPEVARTTLTAALEAWKNGETAEALTARQHPIYFNDLRAEWQLVAFTIADGHERYGQSVLLTAVLTLKMPDGSTKERKITYLIDTAPALVIVQG